jgi:hypothetical protein
MNNYAPKRTEIADSDNNLFQICVPLQPKKIKKRKWIGLLAF